MPIYEAVIEPPLVRCGYPFSKAVHAGCGCGVLFTTWQEVFRCTDCGVHMHRHCLIEHIANDCTSEVKPLFVQEREMKRLHGWVKVIDDLRAMSIRISAM